MSNKDESSSAKDLGISELDYQIKKLIADKYKSLTSKEDKRHFSYLLKRRLQMILRDIYSEIRYGS
jgi:succinate dehydrogenase flavin-adding protein (antitoxin of CptAB toxin-antitoxin module)